MVIKGLLSEVEQFSFSSLDNSKFISTPLYERKIHPTNPGFQDIVVQTHQESIVNIKVSN